MFAVIDTETTWFDKIMSIGIVVADEDFSILDRRYFIISPTYLDGGMFSSVLFLRDGKECTYREAIEDIHAFLAEYEVEKIFAYNATFDFGHLPELQSYFWYDIIQLAAYRQYNDSIPLDAECCKTGRLKRGYGVETILKLLSEDYTYRETHNALQDALDELSIMKLLGYPLETYKKRL